MLLCADMCRAPTSYGGLFYVCCWGDLLGAAIYLLAHYWIESGSGGERGSAVAVGGMGLQGSATEMELQSTLPFPISDTRPTKQQDSHLLLQVFELSWEQIREYLAFGIVFLVLVYFLFAEVYTFMTQPGYFVTGSLRACQTGIFGAIGFVAAGALRNIDESSADENVRDEATLVMASMAFQASPSAMAITDSRGRIEKCNSAFIRITSPSPEYQRYISGSALDTGSSTLSTEPTAYKNMLLETVLGLVNREDVERLQRCINVCESVESDSYRGDSKTDSDYEFLVHGKILNVQVSLGSAASGDTEQALLPFSVLGFLSERAGLATQRSASSAASKRYVVIVNDITFDRSLVRAIHESTALMHHGQSETLMKDMMSRINSTMEASRVQSW
jgi:PAS domain-containing protein